MTLGRALLIGLIIVVILALISYLCRDLIKRRKAEQARIRAGGGNNEDAVEALRLYNEIENPRPADHLRRAEILRYNILENTNIPAAIIGLLAEHYLAAAGIVIEGGRGPQVRPVVILEEAGPAERHLALDQLEDLDLQHFLLGGFGMNEIRRADANTRQLAAMAATETRADALQEYFHGAITHTNHAQSVHDSKVNGDLRDTLRIIERQGLDIAAMFTAARAYIATKPEAERASATLDKMAQGHPIFGSTEDRIFALVWARTLIAENAHNAENLREAIYLALVDCWEHGKMVCTNGRTGRVLGALVGVDANPAIHVLTTEEYKNQIYRECLQLIDDTLEEAKKDPDPELAAAAETFFDEGEPDPRIKKRLRDRIDVLVDGYKNFSEIERQRIKEECYASAILD